MSNDMTSRELYLRLLTYVRPYWKVFLVALGAMALSSLAEPVFPAMMKQLLDKGFSKASGEWDWLFYPLAIMGIFLARAIFGNPVLLVLDEPNASLDHDGAEALNQALRAARSTGAAVLIMSHRPAALQECDLLLVLKDGMVFAVGPRDQVLRETVKNAGHLTRSIAGVMVSAALPRIWVTSVARTGSSSLG